MVSHICNKQFQKNFYSSTSEKLKNSDVLQQKANRNTIFFLNLNSNSLLGKWLILAFDIILLQVQLPNASP